MELVARSGRERASRWFALGVCWLAISCGDGRLAAFTSSPTSSAGSAGAAGTASGGASSAGASSSGAGGSGALAQSGFIDDFEDGDSRPIGNDGWWYSKGDDGGSPPWAVEANPDRAGSALGLHAWGQGYASWSFIGVDLPGGDFDASRFSEVRFWARAEEISVRELSVQMPDANGKVESLVQLTTTWQEYVIPLRNFRASDGSGRGVDAASISHLQFFVFSDLRFDYWLDDVRFL